MWYRLDQTSCSCWGYWSTYYAAAPSILELGCIPTNKHQEYQHRHRRDNLSPDLSRPLLFIYLMAGCDTTSRSYWIGKTAAINRYPNNKIIKYFWCPTKHIIQLKKSVIIHLPKTAAYPVQSLILKGSLDSAAKWHPLQHARHLNVFHIWCYQISQLRCIIPSTDMDWQHTWSDKVGLHTFQNAQAEILKPFRFRMLLQLVSLNSFRKHSLEYTLARGQCKGATCTNAGEIPESD